MQRVVLLSVLGALTSSLTGGCFAYEPDRELPGFCRSDKYSGGQPSVSVVNEWEGERLTRRTVLFYNNDGEYPAGIGDYVYGDDGLLEEYLFDSDVDGEHDERRVQIYEDGVQVREERYDLDTEALAEVYDYEHGADGLLSVISVDSDNDGVHERAEHYGYDDDKQLIELAVDVSLDGDFDRGETYTWEGGLMVREEEHDNWDEEPERTRDFSYDEHGNRVRAVFSEGAEAYETYSYACWG